MHLDCFPKLLTLLTLPLQAAYCYVTTDMLTFTFFLLPAFMQAWFAQAVCHACGSAPTNMLRSGFPNRLGGSCAIRGPALQTRCREMFSLSNLMLALEVIAALVELGVRFSSDRLLEGYSQKLCFYFVRGQMNFVILL